METTTKRVNNVNGIEAPDPASNRVQGSPLEFEPAGGMDYADLERLFHGLLCANCRHRTRCDQGCGFQEEITGFLFPLEEIEAEGGETLDGVMEVMFSDPEEEETDFEFVGFADVALEKFMKEACNHCLTDCPSANNFQGPRCGLHRAIQSLVK